MNSDESIHSNNETNEKTEEVELHTTTQQDNVNVEDNSSLSSKNSSQTVEQTFRIVFDALNAVKRVQVFAEAIKENPKFFPPLSTSSIKSPNASTSFIDNPTVDMGLNSANNTYEFSSLSSKNNLNANSTSNASSLKQPQANLSESAQNIDLRKALEKALAEFSIRSNIIQETIKSEAIKSYNKSKSLEQQQILGKIIAAGRKCMYASNQNVTNIALFFILSASVITIYNTITDANSKFAAAKAAKQKGNDKNNSDTIKNTVIATSDMNTTKQSNTASATAVVDTRKTNNTALIFVVFTLIITTIVGAAFALANKIAHSSSKRISKRNTSNQQ